MSDARLITNHHWRDVVFGYELPAEKRGEFDYLDDEEFATREFIVYRGSIYDLGEFERVHFSAGHPASDWDGYMVESAFSAIVIRFDESRERVQVGLILA